jgi:hypothetical protein
MALRPDRESESETPFTLRAVAETATSGDGSSDRPPLTSGRAASVTNYALRERSISRASRANATAPTASGTSSASPGEIGSLA